MPWGYPQIYCRSKLVLAYIIFGYAIVLFYHFCTPIIFSSMGILVVNDSDKESCRIENWHTQILQYMSTCVEQIPSGFAYGSGNSICFFAWNCQSYSFDNLIVRFSVYRKSLLGYRQWVITAFWEKRYLTLLKSLAHLQRQKRRGFKRASP